MNASHVPQRSTSPVTMTAIGSTSRFAVARILYADCLRPLMVGRGVWVSLVVLALAVIVIAAWTAARQPTGAEFIEKVVLTAYVGFLLPVLCLTAASMSLAGGRDDPIFRFLLLTPVSRNLIYAVKSAAGLTAALVRTFVALLCLGAVAGDGGWEAVRIVWPFTLLATMTYVSVFQCLSAMTRRASVVSLAYALFLESFLGQMPGMVKWCSVSFYVRGLIADSARRAGLEFSELFAGQQLNVVKPGNSVATLVGIIVIANAIGLWCFRRREYV